MKLLTEVCGELWQEEFQLMRLKISVQVVDILLRRNLELMD